MDRRSFIASLAGAAGALALSPRTAFGAGPPDSSRPRIRLVFSHHRQDAEGKQSEPGWPYLGYDHEKKKREILEKLRQLSPGIEFLPATAYDPADAKKILEADAEVDGYLAFMIGGWAGAAETIVAAGKPAIFAGDLFGASGELLVASATARRKGQRVVSVSSSRIEDVARAVRSFECMKRLRSSSILVIGSEPGAPGKAIEEVFGTKVAGIPFQEVNALYEKADRARAREQADRWIREAQGIVEPPREEIEKSAAMYLALRELLDRHEAQAVAMNCLGGVYSGQTHAYPCLGFFQLASDGQVGACEADLESTITMLLMKYLAGRPGYISDPVLDTATNQIIYVHCVAPNRVLGPEGEVNAYEIRSHAEDRKGAAVRSLLPLGQMTTTLKFAPARKQVVLHQARTVANIDDEKSCRTKLAAEVVGDGEKLWTEWDRWGWHRVTFYGDHRRAVEQVSALFSIEVVREA